MPMRALGLGDGMRFVVYDSLGLYAAARVWWTLRAYRVEDVRILEGRPGEMDQGRAGRWRRATSVPGRARSRPGPPTALSLRSTRCAPR